VFWGAPISRESFPRPESHTPREHHAVGLLKCTEVTKRARWQNRRRCNPLNTNSTPAQHPLNTGSVTHPAYTHMWHGSPSKSTLTSSSLAFYQREWFPRMQYVVPCASLQRPGHALQRAHIDVPASSSEAAKAEHASMLGRQTIPAAHIRIRLDALHVGVRADLPGNPKNGVVQRCTASNSFELLLSAIGTTSAVSTAHPWNGVSASCASAAGG